MSLRRPGQKAQKTQHAVSDEQPFPLQEVLRQGGPQQGIVIDCAQPHQLEVTQIVDLLQVFPNNTPSIEDQDNHLRMVCTQAAEDYIGGDDQLYKFML